MAGIYPAGRLIQGGNEVFADAKTGGGNKLGAMALLLALIVAAALAAVAAGPPARPAQGASAASITGLAIVSEPLLSNRVSSMLMSTPSLSFATLDAEHTWYSTGDAILVDVTFSHPALLFTHGDNPTQSLMLNIGGTERAAAHTGNVKGNDRRHRFNYTVTDDDQDDDGIAIGPNALRLHNSWFVNAADQGCAETTTGPEDAPVAREFDCQDYAIATDLTTYQVWRDHQHRVRAQTPEATRNLDGRLVEPVGGRAYIELDWEYSALVSDNAPTGFVITRYGVSATNQRVTEVINVGAGVRQARDFTGAALLDNWPVQYIVAAKNSYGRGYPAEIIVSQPAEAEEGITVGQ